MGYGGVLLPDGQQEHGPDRGAVEGGPVEVAPRAAYGDARLQDGRRLAVRNRDRVAQARGPLHLPAEDVGDEGAGVAHPPCPHEEAGQLLDGLSAGGGGEVHAYQAPIEEFSKAVLALSG